MKSKAHVSIIVLLLLATSVRGHLMRSWSYREMFERSDLVVIAKPLWSKDTKERTKLAGFSNLPDVIGVNTELEARFVLKGNKKVERFVLHHYRFAKENVAVLNGPELVTFDTSKPDTYLLFLVKEADGRYGPVTDQVDPGAFSVIKLDGLAE